MEAIEILEREHDVARIVVDAACREADRIQMTGKVNPDEIEHIVDFLHFFADTCHDPKEEELLFARLNTCGSGCLSGPVAALYRDHESLRAILDSVSDSLARAEAGDRVAIMPLALNLKSYVELMREHMHKEEESIFPLAQSYLSAVDRSKLALEFDAVEPDEAEAAIHEHYYLMALDMIQYARDEPKL